MKFSFAKTLSISCAAAVFAAGGYIAALQFSRNFHGVATGSVYRSAQPTAAVDQYAKDYGIKSIINLRGMNPGSDWYESEIQASRANGIQHFDLAMSASKELSNAEVSKLVSLMKEAPKPLLIHCKAGADRCGLAAALYLSEINHVDTESAEAQIS